jgi:hypothetical protein
MNINYLPPEVLTKIFSYLPQHDLLTAVNIVCLYWNEVAFSSSLWKTIDITDSTDDDLDIYLQNIAHYKDFVQNLLIKSDHLMKLFNIGYPLLSMYTCQNLSTEDLIKQTNSQIYQLLGISGIEWILFPDINPLYIYKIGPLYKGDNSQFEGL